MDELISKDKAIKLLENLGGCDAKDEYSKGYDEAILAAIYDIRAMKPADVQSVKHGYWKDVMMSEATGWDLSLTGGRDEVCETVCSVCGDCCAFGGDGDIYLSPYCPNCGARMIKDGEQNDT